MDMRTRNPATVGSPPAGTRRDLRNRQFPFRVYFVGIKICSFRVAARRKGNCVNIDSEVRPRYGAAIGALRDSNIGILSRTPPRFSFLSIGCADYALVDFAPDWS